MVTQQLLIHLATDLARRPLPEDIGEDDPLYEAALAVERDEPLAAEMAEWDALIADGLTPKRAKAARG